MALLPFMAVVLLVLGPFRESTSPAFLGLMYLTLFWAMVVAGYTLYLTFAVRRPRCGKRFGSREHCRSCDLPRHGYDSSAQNAADS